MDEGAVEREDHVVEEEQPRTRRGRCRIRVSRCAMAVASVAYAASCWSTVALPWSISSWRVVLAAEHGMHDLRRSRRAPPVSVDVVRDVSAYDMTQTRANVTETDGRLGSPAIEANRPICELAYRMLARAAKLTTRCRRRGSGSAVPDCGGIDEPRGWLVTVVARVVPRQSAAQRAVASEEPGAGRRPDVGRDSRGRGVVRGRAVALPRVLDASLLQPNGWRSCSRRVAVPFDEIAPVWTAPRGDEATGEPRAGDSLPVQGRSRIPTAPTPACRRRVPAASRSGDFAALSRCSTPTSYSGPTTSRSRWVQQEVQATRRWRRSPATESAPSRSRILATRVHCVCRQPTAKCTVSGSSNAPFRLDERFRMRTTDLDLVGTRFGTLAMSALTPAAGRKLLGKAAAQMAPGGIEPPRVDSKSTALSTELRGRAT